MSNSKQTLTRRPSYLSRCHQIGQNNSVFVQRFEMCNLPPDEEDNVENIINTVTVNKYVRKVQDYKPIIAQECIRV